jgi:hypothetical protein
MSLPLSTGPSITWALLKLATGAKKVGIAVASAAKAAVGKGQ